MAWERSNVFAIFRAKMLIQFSLAKVNWWLVVGVCRVGAANMKLEIYQQIVDIIQGRCHKKKHECLKRLQECFPR